MRARENSKIWPMQTGGGLFLVCVGASMAIGGALGSAGRAWGVLAGFLIGFLVIPVAIKLARGRFGRPSRTNMLVLWAANILQVAALAICAKFGLIDFRNASGMAVVLAIVAAHFIVMRWSHGPWMLRLGAGLLTWIALCTLLQWPLALLFAGDAVIKILFGALMAVPLLAQLQGQVHVTNA